MERPADTDRRRSCLRLASASYESSDHDWCEHSPQLAACARRMHGSSTLLGDGSRESSSPLTVARFQRFDTSGSPRMSGLSTGVAGIRRRLMRRRGWIRYRARPACVFGASAEVLGVGEVDIVELRCGPAAGSWAREATESADRLRLALLAPAAGATGCWHGREVSLAGGAASVLGRTDGGVARAQWHARDPGQRSTRGGPSDREADRRDQRSVAAGARSCVRVPGPSFAAGVGRPPRHARGRRCRRARRPLDLTVEHVCPLAGGR